MAIAAGRATVSQRLACRFLWLARQAESEGDLRQALTHRLTAIRHDSTARSIIEHAEFLADTGDPNQAVVLLEREASHLQSLSQPDQRASCARSLALLHRQRRDHLRAKQWLQQAAAAEMNAWSGGDATLSPHHLYCESLLAMDAQEFARSRALCDAALVSAAGRDRSLVFRQLARLDVRAGQSESAIRHLLNAARIARQCGDHRSVAECLLELGHVLNSLGRSATAIECYRTAAIRFTRGGCTRQANSASRWFHQTRALSRLPKPHPELN